MKSKVYFTKTITPESLIRLYDAMGVQLPGRVGVKIHSGETGNQNFLRPALLGPVINHVGCAIVECNTAYAGTRNTSKAHWDTMKAHGWTDAAPVDILDEEGDMELPVNGGRHLKVNYVGSHMKNYDALFILSHFKGHPMGGFGGALKNMSIGLASSKGKQHIHVGGSGAEGFNALMTADHDAFLEAMADADKSVMDYYGDKLAFLNVMANLSVDCDCCDVAADPEMGDVGALASLDPVALDQACLDLVYNSPDPGKKALIQRIESRNGLLTVKAAAELGLGSTEYELVDID